MLISKHKFTGCFLGLAIGDAYGASFEGGPLERALWKLIGITKEGERRYTDDSQMSIDVAESFIEDLMIDQDKLAKRFASSYRWSRGYGPSAAKLLKGIRSGKDWRSLNRRKFPEGSLGNGAAMRAPVVALCHPMIDATLLQFVKDSAEITHAHPLAIEGAELVARTTALALIDETDSSIINHLLTESTSELYREKLKLCSHLLKAKVPADIKLVKRSLGNGMLASESVVTAIFLALSFRHAALNEMLAYSFKLGGDTDTIAAMSAAIWGAFNGAETLENSAKHVEGSDRVESLANVLYDIYLSSHQAKKPLS